MAWDTDMHPQPRIIPRSVSGQGMLVWGQTPLASLQIRRVGLLRQCIRIWLIDSVIPQVVHKWRSATLGMRDQKCPILNTSCVALKRNCLILGQIGAFFMLIHIVASVSSFPVRRLIATLACSMFSVDDWQIRTGFLSRMPLYANAWVSDDIFAPWTLKLSRIFRSRTSGFGLAAPSLASWSLCLLPSTPLWPLTHWKAVVAVRRRSRYAALWKNWAFSMPIHP